ncbi:MULTISPECIES: hypothetical protein [Filomicrobium]|uniref:Uncharacterized protein n=1 Tax=Filomicrobium insigne TaxID=418854 RepID=A0A1H0TXV8_9HYPH|nr:MULTISPECIES: hypothetical protein [Filomicrobium]MCV0370618.1 hypothetical protein [Filomicrobium sp.]SDP58779.1 hypothetical protein SAMN04488061_3424 [Filomicrobium insigne]
MGRALGRLLVVPLSFLIAAMVTMAVLFTLGLERVTHVMHRYGDVENPDVLFGLMEDGILLVAGATIIPALAVVVIGEVARIRSVIYYVVGGGIALVSIPLFSGFASGFGAADVTLWQVFATAGFAGGFVYWLLAGRWT